MPRETTTLELIGAVTDVLSQAYTIHLRELGMKFEYDFLERSAVQQKVSSFLESEVKLPIGSIFSDDLYLTAPNSWE